MIPAFSHMGGKARLRNRLVALFPKYGRIYCEPFAGKANIYFRVIQESHFTKYILNDLYEYDFLNALRNVDANSLPAKVDKHDFKKYANSDDLIAKVLEPRITFAGKGYRYGYNGSSGTHIEYSKINYQPKVEEAQRLLRLPNTIVAGFDWSILPYETLTSEDFLYFDPPYINTCTNYPNIDHIKLVEILNNLRCNWVLSGYDCELYTNIRAAYKISIERNSEIKSSNKHQRSSVIETIWMNYIPPDK